MQQPHASPDNQDDQALAKSLAKLWPHREHESNCAKALLCMCGVHRWRSLYLDELLPGRDVQYCFWCAKVRIDGFIYSV